MMRTHKCHCLRRHSHMLRKILILPENKAVRGKTSSWMIVLVAHFFRIRRNGSAPRLSS